MDEKSRDSDADDGVGIGLVVLFDTVFKFVLYTLLEGRKWTRALNGPKNEPRKRIKVSYIVKNKTRIKVTYTMAPTTTAVFAHGRPGPSTL